MSPDEEFVRARHPQADLVEVKDPDSNESKWCVHYNQEIGSRVIGHGDTVEEAWANARKNCAADEPVS